MIKPLLVTAVLMVGCHSSYAEFRVPITDKGGALCQGSRAWQERNVCGPNNTSGLCIRAVDGPIVIQEIRSSEECPHTMWVGIADTWNPWIGINDIESALAMNKPRWEMKSPNGLPLIIKDSSIEVRAGESLFIGTMGHNAEVDSSRCYVTWTLK